MIGVFFDPTSTEFLDNGVKIGSGQRWGVWFEQCFESGTDKGANEVKRTTSVPAGLGIASIAQPLDFTCARRCLVGVDEGLQIWVRYVAKLKVANTAVECLPIKQM